MCTWKPDNSCDSLNYLIEIFALLQRSGTKPTISKYACNPKSMSHLDSTSIFEPCICKCLQDVTIWKSLTLPAKVCWLMLVYESLLSSTLPNSLSCDIILVAWKWPWWIDRFTSWKLANIANRFFFSPWECRLLVHCCSEKSQSHLVQVEHFIFCFFLSLSLFMNGITHQKHGHCL